MWFTAFQKYAVFSGRARRKEYWRFILISIVLSFVLGFIDGLVGMATATPLGLLGLIFTIAIIIPSFSVAVRRLHDLDRSGWWILISFVPILGFLLFIYLMFDGTHGENRFGPDPKAGERASA